MVGCDCGDFGVRVLHPGRVSQRGVVTVGLVVIKVEGFFTVTLVQSRTLHHGEPGGTCSIIINKLITLVNNTCSKKTFVL